MTDFIRDRPVRFAVLGYGNIGRKHAEVIASHAGADLTAIIDVDSEARSVADVLNVPVYENFEDFLKAGIHADVINLCTPNGLHAAHAGNALENGLHVVVEKPFCLTKKECDNVIEHSINRNKRIFCVLQNRYSPPAVFLRKLIGSGALGHIYWVEIHCYWNRDDRYYKPGSWRGTKELDGGTLYTQFSHFVDLLCWLLGDIKPISAQLYNFRQGNRIDFEDTGTFHFQFQGDGAGIFSYSTALWEKNFESSILIIGENGTVKAAGQYMESISYMNVKNAAIPHLPYANPPNIYDGYQGSASNHAFVIDNIIKALRGEEHEIATAREATESVALIEEIYRIAKFHTKTEAHG